MPWKTSAPVDLRMEFITRLKAGERMTDLCCEYGISRKTGHKYKDRFERFGLEGLEDQSRAPRHISGKTPPEVVEIFVTERLRHPNWGAKKLKDVLERKLGRSYPAVCTINAFLKQRGLINGPKLRPRHFPRRQGGLTEALGPNDVWCADYKGQFRLGDQRYCYPLTVTDQYSRYILECEAMAAISEEETKESFAALFRERGLPLVIRSDNGTPFGSSAVAGLTKLSAFWLRLGIVPERIRPAHPEENGRHERMHRTLKRETTRPARHNLLQQQEAFDDFVAEFNAERPHEALQMRRPAEIYTPSPRPMPSKLTEFAYPLHDDVFIVNGSGRISIANKHYFVTHALCGQSVGIREEDDGRLLVSFMHIDLGHFDSSRKLTPLPSYPREPPKLLPMSPG